MHNEHPAMLAWNKRVAPYLQKRRVIRATPHWRFALLGLFATCLIVIGLTVRAQESRPVSGFLGDYSELVPDAKNGDLLVYEKDANGLKKYNKFIFERVYRLGRSRQKVRDQHDARPGGHPGVGSGSGAASC